MLLRICKNACCLFFVLVLATCCVFGQSQKKTITGKVTDTLGISMPGVIVADANRSNVGTQTDNNGKFVPDDELYEQIRQENDR